MNIYLKTSLDYLVGLIVVVSIVHIFLNYYIANPSGDVAKAEGAFIGTFLPFWFVFFIKSLFGIKNNIGQIKHKKN